MGPTLSNFSEFPLTSSSQHFEWYFNHQSNLKMQKQATQGYRAWFSQRWNPGVSMMFPVLEQGKKLPDSSQVWCWLTSDPGACDFCASSNLWGRAYSRCSLPGEVNCPERPENVVEEVVVLVLG